MPFVHFAQIMTTDALKCFFCTSVRGDVISELHEEGACFSRQEQYEVMVKKANNRSKPPEKK